MRRADRLFQIILFLRRRRVATARDLGRALAAGGGIGRGLSDVGDG